MIFKLNRTREHTKCGHYLPPPTNRTTNPSSERDLSPISNCLMKIFVHSACIFVASSNKRVSTYKHFALLLILKQTVCEELAKAVVTNKPLHPEELLNYFWHHLERDFQILCRATQHSFDDCVMFVHSLIRNMLSIEHGNTGMFYTHLDTQLCVKHF